MSAASAPASTSRLRGLDGGRVIGMAMEETGRATGFPTAEDLGALLPEYEVQSIIGRGGMGAVYRAEQRSLARGDAPGFADRFRQEAMTTAGLALYTLDANLSLNRAELP